MKITRNRELQLKKRIDMINEHYDMVKKKLIKELIGFCIFSLGVIIILSYIIFF